jgi:hypothetical protein
MVYVAAALLIAFGDSTAATPQHFVEAPLDFTFVFRALLSGMMMLIIYISKTAEARLELRIAQTEKQTAELNALAIQRGGRLEHVEGKILIIENEQKQQMSLILMQREAMLTGYHDKNDTEKHRLHVETELRNINSRLDMFVGQDRRSTPHG